MLRLVHPITVADLATYLKAAGSSSDEICYGVADAFFTAEDEAGERHAYYTRATSIRETVDLAVAALREALPSN